MPTAVVLGAGIQGICSALALAHQGYHIQLIDQATNGMLRTSLVGEGKIHLGFVYAKDTTMRTPRLMLHAAMRFAPLLEKWLGSPLGWDQLKSRPFAYGVMPDSMVSLDTLLASYARLQTVWDDLRGHAHYAYLGENPARLWSDPIGAGTPEFPPVHGIAHWIDTTEVALHIPKFRQILLRAIEAHSCIITRYAQRVESVARTAHGFCTTICAPSGARTHVESEIVVNCLWAGRLQLDAQLGLMPTRPWSYRLKYSLRGTIAPNTPPPPTVTLVLGRYGDVVWWPQDNSVYASWYPACLQGWSQELAPDSDLLAAAAGEISPSTKQQVIADTLNALGAIVPGLGRMAVTSVGAGIIFAWGQSDIDDPASALHQRADTGVLAHDGYFSINTGKFTTAPLFAQQLVEHVHGKIPSLLV